LAAKPEHEVWSVLVNEFGEIGIDGALLQGTNAHVREVPGGCICCVGGLPMKMALNMLIATTKPDRILIEPTGLGHPEEIINSLTGEYYDQVLDLRASLTLVDPRKFGDKRYSENANFQDQIAVADVLVANKLDLCSTAEVAEFERWSAAYQPAKAAIFTVQQGALQPEWLDYPRSAHALAHPQHHAAARASRLRPQAELYNPKHQLNNDQPFVRRETQGQGHFACGWMFQPQLQFDFNRLFGWMTGLSCMRAKAVLHTNEGVYMYNSENGVLSVNPLELDIAELQDSRIELIDAQPLDAAAIEAELLAHLVGQPLGAPVNN
jgi:G3E family GTPase